MNAKHNNIKEKIIYWILNEYPFSVITKARLYEQIYSFTPEKINYADVVNKLLNIGILHERGEPEKHIYYLIAGKPTYSTKEIICCLYPYGYLSYISAMEWYELTDKIPREIIFTVCNQKIWRDNALRDIKTRLPNDTTIPSNFIPKYPLTKTQIINQEQVIIAHESNIIEPVQIKNTPIRVSSIGKTFIDMLRKPELCGGEEHVLEVYLEHGKKYAKQIITALKNPQNKKIDIARVGFVLDKMLGVQHEQITTWQKEAKNERGSSKKLSHLHEFSPIYDEDWSLSINVEFAQRYVSNTSKY
ncbi:putative transcriptional regulator [Beggiatoa alba B18LD]|uniref:Putative transcriptional regulator n=1 Tax=Beggiatoa alba B18LD TaxID=395493 RepID=I3CHQ7_9GAMM|nr:transcriptional regulator [Beggiatoa alba]EIJ43150.1 putative transcriptional regulator [Beggiatoa alba B18LD]